MAGRGKGLDLPLSHRDQPNDEPQYPSRREPEPEHLTRRSLTRYYVTIHTGWLNDAPTELRLEIRQSATSLDNQHIGNHPPTRTRELANIRTSSLREFLQILINEVAQNRAAAIRNAPPRAHDTTSATTGDPDLDEFIALDTSRNPYVHAMEGDITGGASHSRSGLTTLALIVDRAWLVAPHSPSLHRRELPYATAVALSPWGFTYSHRPSRTS